MSPEESRILDAMWTAAEGYHRTPNDADSPTVGIGFDLTAHGDQIGTILGVAGLTWDHGAPGQLLLNRRAYSLNDDQIVRLREWEKPEAEAIARTFIEEARPDKPGSEQSAGLLGRLPMGVRLVLIDLAFNQGLGSFPRWHGGERTKGTGLRNWDGLWTQVRGAQYTAAARNVEQHSSRLPSRGHFRAALIRQGLALDKFGEAVYHYCRARLGLQERRSSNQLKAAAIALYHQLLRALPEPTDELGDYIGALSDALQTGLTDQLGRAFLRAHGDVGSAAFRAMPPELVPALRDEVLSGRFLGEPLPGPVIRGIRVERQRGLLAIAAGDYLYRRALKGSVGELAQLQAQFRKLWYGFEATDKVRYLPGILGAGEERARRRLAERLDAKQISQRLLPRPGLDELLGDQTAASPPGAALDAPSAQRYAVSPALSPVRALVTPPVLPDLGPSSPAGLRESLIASGYLRPSGPAPPAPARPAASPTSLPLEVRLATTGPTWDEAFKLIHAIVDDRLTEYDQQFREALDDAI